MICFARFPRVAATCCPAGRLPPGYYVAPPLGAFGLVPAAPGRRRGRERFGLPTRKGGRRLFLMRRMTPIGSTAMPDNPTRSFATTPHLGSGDGLVLR